MSILSDKLITSQLIEPFNAVQVNPASYDVTLGNTFIYQDGEKIVTEQFYLRAGCFVLATTQERIKLPNNIAGSLFLKSTVGRLGIDHCLAGWIDPGFEGNITLELHNIGSVNRLLCSGCRIAQIVFHQLLEPCDNPYCGHYSGQTNTTEPWTKNLNELI